MATNDRIVLITGATGQQGGSLIRALQGKGLRLRAMTRRPDSTPALALKALGVELVQGDLDDERSLERAAAGAWGVFAVQNTWEAGVEKEEEQGKRFARVAKMAGVQHYVYTSVGSAHRKTGIPHFENKWRIEETVREQGFHSHVIFRPTFFMENMLTPWFLNDNKITAALEPETKVQMIAVEDVGRFIAPAFTQPEKFNRREIDLAGDAVTMPQAAETLAREHGKPIQFVRIPIETVRQNSADYATMLEWFDKVGYDADIPALAQEFGFKPVTFEEWARKTGA